MLWIFGCIIGLIILIVIVIQIPAVQNYITGKATAWLSKKLNTRVSIGYINVAWPKSILLKDVYIESRQKDTLFYIRSLKADAGLFGLTRRKLNVNSLKIDGLTAHVNRRLPDSAFNFDFILDAFAGKSPDTTQAKPSKKGGWKFAIYGLDLKNVYLTYHDDVSGMKALTRLGHLSVDVDVFNLDKKRFYIDKVLLENTYADATQFKPTPPKTDTTRKILDYDIRLGELKLAKIGVKYRDQPHKQFLQVNLGESVLNPAKIDLPGHKIHLNKLTLNNTSTRLILNEKLELDTLLQVAEKAVTKQPNEVPGQPWSFTLARLEIANNVFRFDDYKKPFRKSPGINYSHILADSINFRINFIKYNEKRISAGIEQLALREKNSGFQLDSLYGLFTYDSVHMELAKFKIKTPRTRLTRYFNMGYKSLQAISDDAENLRLTGDFAPSYLSLRDIIYFAPKLADQPFFSRNPNRVYQLQGIITGTLDNLNFLSTRISTGSYTSVLATGNIKGLTNAKNAYFDFSVLNVTTSRNDLNAILPAGTLPANITLPAKMKLQATITGTPDNFTAALNATTTLGNLMAEAELQDARSRNASYIISARTRDLDLGQILQKTEMLGPVTANAEITGKGFNPDSLHADVKLFVESAKVNGYTYKQFKTEGVFDRMSYTGTATMNDSNLAFDFDGTISFRDTLPHYDFRLALKGTDLQHLGITKDDLRAKGNLSINMQGQSLNELTGQLGLTDVVFTKNDKRYPISKLAMITITNGGDKKVTIESDVLNGYFHGSIYPGDLPEVLRYHMNTYFHMKDSVPDKYLKPQNFEFELTLSRTDLITDIFFPQISRLDPSTIKGKYNSAEKFLRIEASLPAFTISKVEADSLTLLIASDPNKINYQVHLQQLRAAGMEVYNPVLDGYVANDTVSTALKIPGEQGKERFRLATRYIRVDDQFQLRILPDGVTLNYQPWQVSPDNYLLLGNTLYAHDLRLSNGEQVILAQSREGETDNPPMDIRFSNLNLAYLTSVLRGDSSITEGIINGTLALRNLSKIPIFESDLTITGFKYKSRPVGDIRLMADNVSPDRYRGSLQLTGNGNNLIFKGNYGSTDSVATLDFDVNIENLNLASVKDFAFVYVTDMSGNLKGNLKMSGTTVNPKFIGDLHFENATITPIVLNTRYTLPSERIQFDNSGILLKKFTITDSAGNQAVLDGRIYATYFTYFRFDLDVKTKQFMALNSEPAKDRMFYGKLIVSGQSTVKGDQHLPIINTNVSLEKGTEVTIVLPTDDPGIVERKGVVEFVDSANASSPIVFKQKKKDTTIWTGLKGLELAAILNADPKAKIKLVVDRNSGDNLEVSGTGVMSFGINSSGALSLTGRYEITEGAYNLSFYNFVRRRFVIQPGSSIIWLGTPVDANLDIKAIYSIKTNSVSLMEPTTNGLEDAANTMYRQRLPYEVHLTMKGALQKPDILLDVDLEEKEKGFAGGAIVNRLTELRLDRGEINKQAFALLVLGRFVPQDPLTVFRGGDDIRTVAASSVSQMLSQQLNTLASRYIKNVDINFELETFQDFSTANKADRTNLKVQLRKQLVNDRLSLQVGTNVGLQSPTNPDQAVGRTPGSEFISDIAVEYMMTKDGRLRIMIFRNNRYAGIIEGQFVETGAGIIFVKDFNRFKSLFRKPRDNSEGPVEEPKKGKDKASGQ